MTTYYKVLSADGTSPYQKVKWHLPENGKPGKWMPYVKDTLRECEHGYHVLRADQLRDWIVSEALFEVETKGVVVDFGDKCACHQARLVRRVEQWNGRNLRLFAADCAEHVLPIFEKAHPNDKRPREAIVVARRYASGEATDQELDAAWDAARDAAWDAAGAAAWATVGDATWATARDAARDAAWAAARATAWATVGDATWATVGAAARAAEYKWQSERLRQYLGIGPSEESENPCP